VWRIRDVYPGSKFFHPGSRVKKIPHPGSGSASEDLSVVNPKSGFYALGNMIQDVHPGSDLDFLPIPDAGVKKVPDPGTATLLCTTLFYLPPLRFHYVRGCWNQTQGLYCSDFGIGSQTF
jgi:hypothetical protein